MYRICLCVQQVHFEVGDVTKREFPKDSFDVIFSRDTILHINDKHALFSAFYVSSTQCYQPELVCMGVARFMHRGTEMKDV